MKSIEYDIMFRVEDQHWWYRALRRRLFGNIQRYLPDWKSKRFLDVGCGTGANLAQLSQARLAVGLDLAPEALALAQRRSLRQLVRGDAMRLPFAEHAFDALVASSVLYHAWVPDVTTVLAEFQRVLAPRGYIFLELPALESLRGAHDDAVMTARRFTKPEVHQLLESAGYEVVAIDYWNSFLLPVAYAQRRLSRGRTEQSDLGDGEAPGGLSNALFNAVLTAEWACSRVIPMPLGVSMACVARLRA